MRHSYNPEAFALMDTLALVTVAFGFVGAITTTRWFVCRVCGFSDKALYRWTAFWPLIMLLLCLYPRAVSLHCMFGPGVGVAFGLGFSITNLRIPSWYSRGLGAVFALVFGWLLYVWLSDLAYFERFLA